MPLLEMSPNVQEAEGGRKRSHDEYAEMDVLKGNGASTNPSNPLFPRHTPDLPQTSAPLADGTTTTPARASASPNPPQDRSAPTSITDSPEPTSNRATTQPPAKRKRLTAAEKAAKADEEAKKKKEREEARQQKLAEKARQDKEKQAAKAAKQAEKARKEEAEQEAKAAKQQERDEKRRKKEDEERKAREEKERKARSQLKLQSFFTKPTTPKKAAPSPAPGSDAAVSPKAMTASAKKERTWYERTFQPFFVKEHVRMAQTRPWLDDEAADAKARILDEYVSGERGDTAVTPFRPLEALQIAARPRRKGRTYPPVRDIMEELQKNPSALEKLKRIPMKLICFRQDVRPPYYGTLTSAPHQLCPTRLARAARRPNARLLELQYDYDSEAEWQDDEPGDDLDDMDDEEEDLDDEDDMDGFLDDSEDTGVARRLFANGMEPVSTGVCWEDGGAQPDLKPYRMEVILEGIDPSAGIDPTSAAYWSPPRKKTAPVQQPSNAFDALKSNNSNPEAPSKPQIRPELVPDFKRAVLANQKLSKMAIVEVLGVQFEALSKAETKAMLEFVAERGHGRGKVWELKEGV